MNKKILVFFTLLLFFNLVNAVLIIPPSLSITWSQPSSSTTIIGKYGPNLLVIPKIYCNDGPCNDMQGILEYCLGDSCTNYQTMCYGSASTCSTEPVYVTISSNTYKQNPCTPKDSLSGYYYCWWDLSANYPSYYGQTIELRVKATASNVTNDAYLTGREYYVDSPTTVTLNQPSSNVSKEKGETLTINWTTKNDPEGDNQRSRIYYNPSAYCTPIVNPITYGTVEIYDSAGFQSEGTYSYDWTIPNDITAGEYCVFVQANYVADAVSTVQRITITDPPSISISSPQNNNVFVIGSEINFTANVFDAGLNYTVEWDSNKDLDWKSTNENFSYSGLSIGDHKITLTGFFDKSGNITTKTDSVQISVVPISTDVLGIRYFEIYEPADKILQTTSIRILAKTKIDNFTATDKNVDLNVTLINAETGQRAVDRITGIPYEPFNEKALVPAYSYVQISNYIGLIKLNEGNYKLVVDISEYQPEQNTANNHLTEIVTVTKAVEEIKLSEIEVIILPVIILLILLIINKEKITELIKKKDLTAKKKNNNK